MWTRCVPVLGSGDRNDNPRGGGKLYSVPCSGSASAHTGSWQAFRRAARRNPVRPRAAGELLLASTDRVTGPSRPICSPRSSRFPNDDIPADAPTGQMIERRKSARESVGMFIGHRAVAPKPRFRVRHCWDQQQKIVHQHLYGISRSPPPANHGTANLPRSKIPNGST